MKTSKKIISLLLSAAIIMSAMVITAVSAAAAADGSEVYFDNSVFNWENVYIMPMVQKKMPNGRVS